MWPVALLLVYLSGQVWRLTRRRRRARRVPRPWWSVKNDRHIFNNVVRHLMESDALEEGTALLLDYRFVEAQLRETDMQQVVQDYAWAAGALREAQGAQGGRPVCAHLPAIEDIDSALRMARPTLSVRPQELAFQLTGRLHALKKKNGSVAQLIESAKEHAPVSCILALSQCLPVPICGIQASIPVSEVKSASFLPDADRAVVVGYDGQARVLDISRAEPVYEIDGRAGRVNCVASYVMDAMMTIVTGGEDGTLRFWDAETGAATGGHINASDEVIAVAASKDGLYVASVSSHGEVRRWSTRLREEAGMLAAAEGEELDVLHAVAISADGRRVAAAIRLRQVHVWDMTDGAAGDVAPAALLGAHEGYLRALAMTEDGCTVVASGEWDCTVRVWRVSDRAAFVFPIKAATFLGIASLCVIGDARVCVGPLFSGWIEVYDMHSHALLTVLPRAHSCGVDSLDASADGRRLMSCGGGLVRVWSLEHARGLRGGWEGSARPGPLRLVECVAASADGRWVVSGHIDCVMVWDAGRGEADGEPLVGDGEYSVSCVVFSPDSRRIVCGMEDGSVRVWSIKRRREVLRPIRGHYDCVSAITVSPDGKRIVSGSRDQTVRVWCMQSGAPVFGPLEGHNNCISSVGVSPDCRYILSESSDDEVLVWRMSSGDAVGGPLFGHSGGYYQLWASPGSPGYTSWSWDEALVWCITTKECERIAERGDRRFWSNAEVLAASDAAARSPDSGDRAAADQSARLRISCTARSTLIYSGDPSNESVAGSFDSLLGPTPWHYDSKRRRLWAGFIDMQMGVVYMK